MFLCIPYLQSHNKYLTLKNHDFNHPRAPPEADPPKAESAREHRENQLLLLSVFVPVRGYNIGYAFTIFPTSEGKPDRGEASHP